MNQVLVVEDEPAIAELVAINLRHAGYSVACAGNADDAQRNVDQQLPDAVLLDWMLPGISGVQLARRWRAAARTRQMPILMLTARDAEGDKVGGLDAGADDYLTKPFSTGELLARLRAVLRRRHPEASDLPLEVGGLRLDPAVHRVTALGPDDTSTDVPLGPTEFRMLRFLMAHPDRVHTRAQLLDRVWGDHVFIQERTVDVRVKRLREALAAVGFEDRVETVRGVGYRFASVPGSAS